jgi:sarcosine oxidase
MASAIVTDVLPGSAVTSRARFVSALQRQGALLALVALVIFGVVRYGPSFYSVYNIFDAFLNNNTYYALTALGMTFVNISGGIDLSVGSVAVLAAVAAATAAGAAVVEGQAVREILPDPERPAVRLDDRILVARRLVVSVGAWLPWLVPDLDLPLRVVRRVQTWFEAASPAEFSSDRFPIFIRGDDSGDQNASADRSWYGCPTMDGATVKVALHDWPGIDEPVDPAAGPRAPDDADAERVAALVETGLPGLRPGPVRMQACMYTVTPDLDFIVGRRRDLPGITLLAGFSGHGFKFAPALGEVAAQLALTGVTDQPIGLFDPHRFDARPR